MSQVTVTLLQEDMITLTWVTLVEGPETGNSDLTSYQLYYDDATAVIDFLLYDSLGTEFTVTGLVGGETYSFAIQACNIYGCGDISDALQVIASDVPDQTTAVTTTIDGTNVVIDWPVPDNNYKEILEYDIVFEHSDSTYVQDLTNCDG